MLGQLQVVPLRLPRNKVSGLKRGAVRAARRSRHDEPAVRRSDTDRCDLASIVLDLYGSFGAEQFAGIQNQRRQNNALMKQALAVACMLECSQAVFECEAEERLDFLSSNQ